MKFNIITIFPHIFDSYLNESILKRAQKKNLIQIKIHNLRDFTKDKHKKVD
ncbi:tRNA (guanosine(37)-N1)-methyltransferase TrmD, partial [Candidatus Wolfebacteria bacterium CG18_big_fil_WC_8_21_14_2_50_39_7]